MRFSEFSILATGLTCALLLAVAPVPTQADEARNARERIILSLKQATLVHSMTGAACFAMGGDLAPRASDIAMEERDAYTTVLTGLADGHQWMGLLPEENAEMRAFIAQTQSGWRSYGAAVAQIVHNDFRTVIMAQILYGTSAEEKRASALATRMIEVYGPQVFDAKLTNTLKLASHMRMLTQKAIKESCFLYFGLGGAAMQAQFEQTLADIDAAILRLSEGDGEISPPPNGRITRNLRTARLFWDKMVPVMQAIAAGEDVASKDIQKMIKFNVSVLKQLNQSVEGYLVGV